jgi:hypothetical protein
MERYLAVGSSSSAGGGPWITVAITGLFVTALIVGPLLVRRMRKISGPVLAGTAQVLSLQQFGSLVVNGPARQICRFRLRVEVPGREPYEVTHWQNFAPWDLAAVAPGETVGVEVDSTKPKRVRIRGDRAVRRHPGPAVVFDRFSAPPTPTGSADLSKRGGGGGPEVSAADLLASGQRAPGLLKSFATMGTTPRSLGRMPSLGNSLDTPHYRLEVELHLPNLAPITGRAIQPVPESQVPNLAIGLELDCAVDPADPSHRFVVDWPDF